MSGFSPDWLALREPVDHRARNPQVAARLTQALAVRPRVRVVDLGCGTGSNIRATAGLLGSVQDWTLVDYDARLIAVARLRLMDWADTAQEDGEGLALTKDGRQIAVQFRQADLVTTLEAALGEAPDLVTASALFDLCSADFLARFARAVAARRAIFYTVLTYDGEQDWTPPDAADARLLDLFRAHQQTDKGFGAAAGWAAPQALARAFEAVGYAVLEGASPWSLGPDDAGLVRDLADGFAAAAAEMDPAAAGVIAAWRDVKRTGARVGHTDTLALPPV